MGARRDALEGPALALAADLRAAGQGGVAAALEEQLPEGAIPHDEHLPELTARLRQIASTPSVGAALQERARRLAGVATDLPSAIGRTGTVWISWWQLSERAIVLGNLPTPPHYLCSWQGQPGDPDLLEDGPNLPDLEVALAWARRRSRSIIVRPAWDSEVHYWAGDGPPADGLPRLAAP